MQCLTRYEVEHENSKYIFEFSIKIFKSDSCYIANCSALDLCTQGKTEEEAKQNFEEAFKVWFETIMDMGTLKEALKELGWVEKEYSKCCVASLRIEGKTTQYYVCNNCKKPCDRILKYESKK